MLIVLISNLMASFIAFAVVEDEVYDYDDDNEEEVEDDDDDDNADMKPNGQFHGVSCC